MQNQIKLPDQNRLLESANLKARFAESMAQIAGRIEMLGEAAGIDMTSSISTDAPNSGTIRIEALADIEEATAELIDDFLDEEAV